jgi:hypothetical protein
VGAPTKGAVCSTCTDDLQCQGATLNPRRCERAPGAATGYCTWEPFSDPRYCPAGFLFLPDAIGVDRCVPALSCAAYFASFGQGCFSDEACRAGGALPTAVCRGADPAAGLPGFCTAACRILVPPNDSCVVPGFHCVVPPSQVMGLCERI